MEFLVAYLATAVVFFAIDYVWLVKVAKPLFDRHVAHLMAPKPRLGAAAGFYILYVFGIVFFAVAPALGSGDPMIALLYGLLFGFFAYATYDMTNYATLQGWPFFLSLIDTSWGAVLTGAAALSGYYLSRFILAI